VEPANAQANGALPTLNAGERKQVERRVAISAFIVHETVREEGERELVRAPAALAWSGLAAGLSMGFSLLGQGLLRAYLPAAPWRPLVASLGYSVGFVIVVLGRQQLFTENTLTAILPLLAHPNLRTFGRVARLWALVLVANLLGALIFATVVAHTSLFPPFVQAALAGVARDSLRGGFGLTVLRGIFAGWLIALMVWLLPAAENARLHIIVLLTYLVSLGGFAHIIAGAVEALYLVNIGTISWGTFFFGFTLPTLIGNSIGGVSLVAALNFAQVAAESSGNAGNAGNASNASNASNAGNGR
jgi:formate/nitrite transporter FocA (FNT family)